MRRRTAGLAIFVIAITTALTGEVDRAFAAHGPPVALLLHAGGFIFDDPGRMAEAAEIAAQAGFEPQYVDYPAGNLRGAVYAAQSAAQRLRRRGREVYAYGDSAGGTLAGLLAERHLVIAAAAYSPVANLRRFANYLPDPQLYRTVIGADRRLLLRDSPGLHDSNRPILAMRPIGGSPFMTDATRKWDLRDADVKSVAVSGGHLGDPADPSVYIRNAQRAFRWLLRKRRQGA